MRDFGRVRRKRPLIIIGLGNEILTDDGLGIRVVRMLKERLRTVEVDIQELQVGGFHLLDYVTGYQQCIIVDAIVTGIHPPGTSFRFTQTPESEPVTITSSHQLNLAQVLTLGKLLGADVPERLTVYAMEASDVMTFHDGCTEEVARAIPDLVETVYRDVKGAGARAGTGAGRWQRLTEICPV